MLGPGPGPCASQSGGGLHLTIARASGSIVRGSASQLKEESGV